ncbi:hypothetical protein LCGC14_0359900 [marine sediment metagenome]|uniref:Uncharacterized protein n=1 Tax=marine sediment metagenome TaxID=412755 RepID=A0A0F9VVG5_9ZZZZ
MAKGKWKATLLGIQGLIGHRQAPDWDFLYARSTTINPNYVVGDRVVTPDGRVFRYAKAGGTLQCDYACKFSYNEYIEYATLAQSEVAGAKSVKITVSAGSVGKAADGVITVDELRGGYIAIFMAGLGDNQSRGIIGNSALAADGTSIIVYLDASLDRAVDSSDAAEVLGSPYDGVQDTQASADAYASKAGLPNVPATVNQYCWIQTAGPRWMSPTASATGGASQERDVYFDSNGGVSEHTYNSSTVLNRQRAGFIIDKQTAGVDGAPFIMLQISS